MGLLFSRRNPDERQAERERWRGRRLEEGSRRRSGRAQRHTRQILDDFRDACQRQDWDNAPMSLWHQIRDEHTAEMVQWLNANRSFVPPYGIYIGEPGTEPWRPVVTAPDGTRRRWRP